MPRSTLHAARSGEKIKTSQKVAVGPKLVQSAFGERKKTNLSSHDLGSAEMNRIS